MNYVGLLMFIVHYYYLNCLTLFGTMHKRMVAVGCKSNITVRCFWMAQPPIYIYIYKVLIMIFVSILLVLFNEVYLKKKIASTEVTNPNTKGNIVLYVTYF